MLFAYRVVSPLAGFTGACRRGHLMTMFLLGPALEFVGFGRPRFRRPALFISRRFRDAHRGARDLIVAGVLIVLASTRG
jgi:hypothetical protein